VWRFDTESGPWVVKVDKPWGDFWYGVAAQGGKFEAAAWDAGVAMAEPHRPVSDGVGLWQPIGEGRLAKAARFLEGAHPVPPLSAPLAEWAGGTVAALARLGIVADPAVDADYVIHPQDEWDEWLGEARDLGVLDAEQARALKDASIRIAEITEAGLASKPVKLVMHRDFSYLNILVTAEGPVLLDFDSAGPSVPWWEMISVAWELAGPGLGVMEPERALVEAGLAGYAAAGGPIGATDESAFTGQLAGRLSSTAWELWMACGHRNASPASQAQLGRHLRLSIPALTTMLDALPTWATWLKG